MLAWLEEQGPTFNAILITALAGIVGVFGFSFLGWLGVAMLGLAGIFLAVRIDLSEDSVAGDMTTGGTGYARQVEEMAKRDPRERQAETVGRETAVAVLKSVGIALAVFGFVMLFLGG